MSLDREVCLCFHVTRRKLLNYIRLEQPHHASQLSECFGAGTGCGWCRPFLRKIFEQSRAHSSSNSSERTAPENLLTSAPNPACVPSEVSSGQNARHNQEFETLSEDDYAAQRAKFIAEGGGTPPAENENS
jgi:bacterioferritin-associated ferredoxin